MDYNVNFEKEGDKLSVLFKELEGIVKNECNKNGILTDNKEISYLINKLSEKNSIVRKHKKELDFIRDVRNFNTHQMGIEYKYPICPSPEVNLLLKNIIDEIKNPPTIYNSKICIKKQLMYCRTLEDRIYETIKKMTEKLYTYVPILEDGKLVGVFSENTLLDIVNLESGIIIDEETKFDSIKSALMIENHSMEDFVFVARNKNVYDIELLFKDYFSRNKILGCIYVTENGKRDEQILGMLTAWDVLGNSN